MGKKFRTWRGLDFGGLVLQVHAGANRQQKNKALVGHVLLLSAYWLILSDIKHPSRLESDTVRHRHTEIV